MHCPLLQEVTPGVLSLKPEVPALGVLHPECASGRSPTREDPIGMFSTFLNLGMYKACPLPTHFFRVVQNGSLLRTKFRMDEQEVQSGLVDPLKQSRFDIEAMNLFWKARWS